MRFAYARRGGPLLDWSGPTPPYPTRAGETRSLGDFYPTTRNSNALRRYGGRGPVYGAAVGYEHNRSLGAFYPTSHNSNALRRYGGVSAGHGGATVGYEHNRELGYWGSSIGQNGSGYHPAPGMGAVRMSGLDIPRPGAPEVVEGYEPPQPGAAIIHLGDGCTFDLAHRRSHGLSGYMPEGAARRYGQQMLGAEAPVAPRPFDMGLVRKASAVAAGYHGVKRNNGSILWGLVWAAAAFITPLYGTLVPAFAAAQGFGQAKVRNNPARASHRKRMKAAKRIVAAAKRRKKKRVNRYPRRRR